MPQIQTIGKHKTTVKTTNGETVVRYHETDVVVFNDIVIQLNSGGWMTATTKLRMNQASNQFNLGYRVFQKDHVWYVTLPSGKTLEYIDGFTISRI